MEEVPKKEFGTIHYVMVLMSLLAGGTTGGHVYRYVAVKEPVVAFSMEEKTQLLTDMRLMQHDVEDIKIRMQAAHRSLRSALDAFKERKQTQQEGG
jgi:UDP-N-acetylglucosamine:LPS N-acetylglucosamine transferase